MNGSLRRVLAPDVLVNLRSVVAYLVAHSPSMDVWSLVELLEEKSGQDLDSEQLQDVMAYYVAARVGRGPCISELVNQTGGEGDSYDRADHL
jgi:hypothetical protein